MSCTIARKQKKKTTRQTQMTNTLA